MPERIWTGAGRDVYKRQGLGLSIVKHIVNFYHGTIHVTSELDKGTEFTVTIPLDMHK